MILELPAFPFDSHQLEPYLSKAWVEERYQGDHQRHLAALNRWASDTDSASRSLEDVISKAHGEVLEHALEAWNLTLFWHCLLPRPTAPEGRLNEDLTRAFGSFTGLREAMHERVEDETVKEETREGSRRPDWLWLLSTSRGLALTTSARGQRLGAASGTPLLVMDLGCGKSPVEQLWPLIHWDFVAQNLGDCH
ncbi:MAG: hypothetical protein CME82_00195 [Halomonas sp.]|nr:hypothetical protein [Halomonas sp.]